jgi:polysaccharide pyruvyl transferase WcaK-like protein
MGHEVCLIRRTANIPAWKFPLSLIKRTLLKYIFRKDLQIFIDTYLQPQTSIYYSTKGLKKLNNDHFDAFIVGSDQVWREKFNRSWKKNYFLDFVNTASIRIAYAASFGVDTWDYNEEDTKELSQLAGKFDGISVREDSGIALCKMHLNVSAVQVLDPVLLLPHSDYLTLISSEEKTNSSGGVLACILDTSDEKQSIVNSLSRSLQCTSFSMYSHQGAVSRYTILPSVTHWLHCFHIANYVVTDSYHGCVFAILFNKPFFVIGNEYRGLTRFTSLLKIFGLEERFMMHTSDLTQEKLHAEIDWEKVNTILTQKRSEAYAFLNKYLKK